MAGNTTREEDQRKRTLEALQRRFAAAEAELAQQNKKANRLIDEDGRKAGLTNPSSSSSVASATSLAAVSAKTPPRRGFPFFFL